jgi:opacity protein-like surface antigen
MIKRYLLVSLLLLVPAAAARAEVMITPFAGAAFGGDVQSSLGTYGIALGFLGGGVFGFEAELGWTPNFFEAAETAPNLSSNRVQSFDFNLILALPAGAVRVYGTAGVGVIGSKVSANLSNFDFSNTNAGYNVGGGLIISLSKHFALRGDLRYFRTFGTLENSGDLAIQQLDYWRGVGGLVFKF